MSLDTSTIAFVSVMLVTSLGLLQLWLWRCDRSLDALALWGTAYLLASTGLLLILARGSVPHRVSIDIAVGLIILAYSFGWTGARRFEQQPTSLPATLAGVVIWLVACQIPVFYHNLASRTVGASLLIGVYDSLCAWEFLRKREGRDLPSRRFLGVVFCAGTAVQVFRALVTLVAGLDQPTFSLPESVWFGVPATVGTVFAAITSVLLIAVAKEATERRSVAVIAAAKDAADRANLAKSRFLARMSHELRTPLNAVLGMAQVLTRDPALVGAQRERAELLEQSGRHLLAIINDILDLASAEANRFHIVPQPSAVSDIIQGSIDLMAGSALAKHITLDVVSEPGVPAAVLGDPLRIRQILLNLLGNAIKFTPAGGSVRLRVSRHSAAGGLRLSVVDTGPGVPADFRPHLFQDFAQRPVEAGGSGGTGLGLAISASLAQAMGGAIEYHPGDDGIGSVFTVVLPLPAAEAPAAPAPTAVEPSPPATGLRILVVDDVASNRRLAEVLLQQAGHTVQLAADAETAFALLANAELPDAVLMDVHMPGMSGLAAARRIRTMQGAAGLLPILALTADVSRDSAQEFRDAGMDGFITKPIELEELLKAIIRVTAARPITPVAAVMAD